MKAKRDALILVLLGTRPNGLDGQSPMHTTGFRLKDGRVLPTYDWIVPASSPEASNKPVPL